VAVADVSLGPGTVTGVTRARAEADVTGVALADATGVGSRSGNPPAASSTLSVVAGGTGGSTADDATISVGALPFVVASP
jgi:hypothetical protein